MDWLLVVGAWLLDRLPRLCKQSLAMTSLRGAQRQSNLTRIAIRQSPFANTKGYSLIMTLFAGTMVLITGLVTATLLGSQFTSLANYKYSSDAYAVAKAGINAAVEELNGNNPPLMTQANPLRGQVNSSTNPGQPMGSYKVTLVGNKLRSTGTVTDDRLGRRIDRTVSVDLTPQTGKFEESFSTTTYKDPSTSALWGNGIAQLPGATLDTGDGTDGALTITTSTTIYRTDSEGKRSTVTGSTFVINSDTTGGPNGTRRFPDAYVNYTADSLTAGSTTSFTVKLRYDDFSGTGGFALDDEILIADTKSNSNGNQESARIQSISGSTITLTAPVKNSYSGNTSITRIPQYTSVTVDSGAAITTLAWSPWISFGGDPGQLTTGGLIFFRANTVQIRGKIDVTGKGYSAAYGPGAGTEGGYGAGGGGGSYAGTGGTGGLYDWYYTGPGGRGGPTYGTAAGVEFMGSGGWYIGGSKNSGGGRIKIIAENLTITNTGSIQSNGGQTDSTVGNQGGGGSGGGIYLESKTFNNSGILSAAGAGGGSGIRGQTGGNNGVGGKGQTSSGIGGNGGSPGLAGRGGNGSKGSARAADGGNSAGGGGGGTRGTDGGGGGGGAGRIAIHYQTYNGVNKGSDGYYGPTGSEVTGPWAYYVKVNQTYVDNRLVLSSNISGQPNIRQATINIYPAADSAGTISNLSMSTEAGPGTITGTNSINVSTGNGPYPRTFTWANPDSNLTYSFNLNTADPNKTPRIDKIVVDYITTKFNIVYSTWQTD